MKKRYLEVTYRNGKPFAAYFYLPRKEDDAAVRSEDRENGILVDFASDGRPIGIEITAPTKFSLEAINAVLLSLRQDLLDAQEVAPLKAAA